MLKKQKNSPNNGLAGGAEVVVGLLGQDESGYSFSVKVHGEDGSTSHKVTLSFDDYEVITEGKIPPDRLVEKSFGFLLAREPKESILGEFNITEIQKYFPEYTEEARTWNE